MTMIPEWRQYAMALWPVAVVGGMMLYLYFFGDRSRDGKRASSPRDGRPAGYGLASNPDRSQGASHQSDDGFDTCGRNLADPAARSLHAPVEHNRSASC
jgi:hypothetical protein